MKYIHIIIIFAVHTFSTGLYSQEKKTTLAFDYYAHDFGTIKEDGGLVTYEFKFTNSGNAPLIIKNITAACGCTVPTWSKDPISPGNVGKIMVEFSPINKPGSFSKTLTVFSNSYQDGTILTLMGKVTPKPRKPHDDYPDKIGNMRMISRYMNLGDITTEKWQRKVFEIFNQSDTVISVSKIIFNAAYLNIKIEPADILPKTNAKISVEMSPKWRNDFGYVQDNVEIHTNDKIEPIKKIFVNSHITMFFPEMSADEIAKAPKAKIDKAFYDFGTIKQGDKVTAAFIIKNEGINELQLFKVRPSCGCTIVEIDKKVIKSGEVGKLTILFNSAGKEGIQEKHINLYTNDPKNHNIVVTVKSRIAK